MLPSSISLADALIYEMLCFLEVCLILLSVFSPTPLVGFETDLSNDGLSLLLKITFKYAIAFLISSLS